MHENYYCDENDLIILHKLINSINMFILTAIVFQNSLDLSPVARSP